MATKWNQKWFEDRLEMLRKGESVRMATAARQHFLIVRYDKGLVLKWTNLGGGVWEASTQESK